MQWATIHHPTFILYACNLAKWLCFMPLMFLCSPGGTQKFLGRYVTPRFSKAGSPELIFSAWNWGLWNKFLLKCVSQELKFNQNQWKLDFKKQTFPKIEVRSLELQKSLKWWVSGAKKLPEKGGLEGGTSPYYLLMWVHPPGYVLPFQICIILTWADGAVDWNRNLGCWAPIHHCDCKICNFLQA